MRNNLMTQCEQKKKLALTSLTKVEWHWVRVPVSLVGSSYEAIRCAHCHGAVRMQKMNHGSLDHVEHRSRQDSEHCKGGIRFQGKHRLSLRPVQ
jgi:hypothetical protein